MAPPEAQRRGRELFTLSDDRRLDLDGTVLAVQQAVYDGACGTPKTVPGLRSIPLADLAVELPHIHERRDSFVQQKAPQRAEIIQ